MVDVAQLEFCIRDDLNTKVPRVMCVLDPLKITIENYEGEEEIEASYYPHDVPKVGSRKLPFAREIYIERDDFMERCTRGLLPFNAASASTPKTRLYYHV